MLLTWALFAAFRVGGALTTVTESARRRPVAPLSGFERRVAVRPLRTRRVALEPQLFEYIGPGDQERTRDGQRKPCEVRVVRVQVDRHRRPGRISTSRAARHLNN